ncbi:MAG: hypothetical protein HC902_08190 [Calothrix sp. SM1_5_4]|nr:hypothetical protein [Calothrix sp. SM1_5_4]
MGKKRIQIGAVIAAVTLAGGAGFYLWKINKGRFNSSRAEFEKALSPLKAGQSNPMSKAFEQKDFAKIQELLRQKSSGTFNRMSLLQGGVVYFDGSGGRDWSDQDLVKLAEILLDRLQESLKSKEREDRQSVPLNFHLLKRVLARVHSPEISSRVEKQGAAYSVDKNPYEFGLFWISRLSSSRRLSPVRPARVVRGLARSGPGAILFDDR